MEAAKTMLTVTQVNEYLKMLLDGDRVLSHLFVRGELSNCKLYSSGHLYFTLKDETGQLRGVMFRSYASRLRFRPEDGMRVILHGRVSVYEANGQYQLYADDMQPDGVGSLAMQFEQLKRRLSGEGLFDSERKRSLPTMPLRIGVITSPSGAAIRDIIRILGRRFPAARVILYPSLVQGVEAPAELISGLQFFALSGLADVIILGRGGGSAEDLWAFNDETLVRTVAASPIPVISAVGHESDFTLCDFAADCRAATPSAAAELAVPDMQELLRRFRETEVRMQALIERHLSRERKLFNQLSRHRLLLHPEHLMETHARRLDATEERVGRAVEQSLANRSHRLSTSAGKLGALDPLAVLSRGYAAVSREGKTALSAAALSPGDYIDIRFADGSITAEVKKGMNA